MTVYMKRCWVINITTSNQVQLSSLFIILKINSIFQIIETQQAIAVVNITLEEFTLINWVTNVTTETSSVVRFFFLYLHPIL